jgi:hypothetical protein
MLNKKYVVYVLLSLFVSLTSYADSGAASTGKVNGAKCSCPKASKLANPPLECGDSSSTSKFMVGKADCSSNSTVKTCEYTCFSSTQKRWIEAGTQSCVCHN